jgi:hypothetical protein
MAQSDMNDFTMTREVAAVNDTKEKDPRDPKTFRSILGGKLEAFHEEYTEEYKLSDLFKSDKVNEPVEESKYWLDYIEEDPQVVLSKIFDKNSQGFKIMLALRDFGENVDFKALSKRADELLSIGINLETTSDVTKQKLIIWAHKYNNHYQHYLNHLANATDEQFYERVANNKKSNASMEFISQSLKNIPATFKKIYERVINVNTRNANYNQEEAKVA